jgi:hypothetical protein
MRNSTEIDIIKKEPNRNLEAEKFNSEIKTQLRLSRRKIF